MPRTSNWLKRHVPELRRIGASPSLPSVPAAPGSTPGAVAITFPTAPTIAANAPAAAIADARTRWDIAREHLLAERLNQATRDLIEKGRYRTPPPDLRQLAQELGHREPRQGDIPITVMEGFAPIYVTPQELTALAGNRELAREFFTEATGIDRPSRRQLSDFIGHLPVPEVPLTAAVTPSPYAAAVPSTTSPAAPLPAIDPRISAMNSTQRILEIRRLGGNAAPGMNPTQLALEATHLLRQQAPVVPSSATVSSPPLAALRPHGMGVPHIQRTPTPPRERAAPVLPPAEMDALLRRAAYPRRAEEEIGHVSGIAPFNRYHREAEHEQRRGRETTEEELADLGRHLQRLREREVLPHLQEDLTAARNQDIRAQMIPYNELIGQMRADARERWHDEIAPALSGQFAIMGATRSGAHARALQRAHQSYNRDVEREISKLQVHGLESARDAAERQQSQALQRAQVGLHGVQSELEHGARTAQLGTQHAQQQGVHHAAHVAGLGQLAHQHQVQQQNVLNERERRHYEEAHLPVEAIQNEMASGRSGVPIVARPFVPQPLPPSGMNVMGGLISALPGMMMQGQQMGQHAKGGKVKRKFADGGYVGNAEHLTQQLANTQFNPWVNTLTQVGAHMLAANPGKAIQGLGKGLHAAHAQNLQAHGAQISAREKAANLYMQMQESLRHQEQFLKQHALHEQQFAENKRHHQVGEELARMGFAVRNAPQEEPSIKIGGKNFKTQGKIGLSPQDHQQAKRNDELLQKLEAKEAPYNETLEFLSTNKPNTGIIANFTPNALRSDTDRAYQRNLSSMVSSVVSPGPLTKTKREFAELQKPTALDEAKTVEKFALRGKKVIEEEKEPLILAQEYRTYGIPDRITLGAYKEWAKHGKKGEFEDYLQAVLSGEELPTPSEILEEGGKGLSPRDIMDDPNLSKEQKIESLKAMKRGT
jgi:hypothetical protein